MNKLQPGKIHNVFVDVTPALLDSGFSEILIALAFVGQQPATITFRTGASGHDAMFGACPTNIMTYTPNWLAVVALHQLPTTTHRALARFS